VARLVVLSARAASVALAAVTLAAALAGCFFDPQLGKGKIACAADGSCASGQVCGGDDRCYPPGPTVHVHVTIDPVGAGRVTSLPAGVDCGDAECSAELPSGVPIRLTASASEGYRFASYDGCVPAAGASAPTCELALDAQASGDVHVHFVGLGGRTLWARGFGGVSGDEAYGIATAPMGTALGDQLFVAGGFASPTVDLGPGFEVFNHGVADSDDALVAGFSSADGATRTTRVLGSIGYDNLWHVAIDSDGNVLIAGYIEGSVDLGGGARTCTGYDPFVASYDPSGAWLWDRVFPCGGALVDEAQGLAIDQMGNVFVSGTFGSTCNFGDGVTRDGGSGDGSPFVVKLAGNGTALPAGQTIWARHFPAATGGTGSAMRAAAAMNGDVAVVGSFRGSLALPDLGTHIDADGLQEDAFAIRLTGNGATVWARRFGGAGADWANSVTIDSDDNVLLTGRFQETVDFGNGARPSVGLADVFLVKLAGSGTPAWDVVFGGTGDDDGYGVAIDFDHGDDVLVGGGIDGTVDLGGGLVVTTESRDGFVARFGADGTGPTWMRRLGGADNDTVFDVALAQGGSHPVVAVGSFRGSVDFGGPGLLRTTMGERDIFVLALSP